MPGLPGAPGQPGMRGIRGLRGEVGQIGRQGKIFIGTSINKYKQIIIQRIIEYIHKMSSSKCAYKDQMSIYN